MKEPLLEKLLRRWRVRKVAPYVPEGGRLLDLGCGWGAAFLRHAAPRVKEAFGLDAKAETRPLPENVRVFRHRLESTPWPVEVSGLDAVSLLAVLEHLDEATAASVLSEARRVLRRDGRLILTVPTPSAKPVLEFLAYRLRIVNEVEIRDHKIYYDRALLDATLSRHGFAVERYGTFQLGWNSVCVARAV